MPEKTTVPDDDPLMIAWVAYTATPEYANSRRWAAQPPHTDGAMWAAFEAGYRAALAPKEKNDG